MADIVTLPNLNVRDQRPHVFRTRKDRNGMWNIIQRPKSELQAQSGQKALEFVEKRCGSVCTASLAPKICKPTMRAFVVIVSQHLRYCNDLFLHDTGTHIKRLQGEVFTMCDMLGNLSSWLRHCLLIKPSSSKPYQSDSIS